MEADKESLLMIEVTKGTTIPVVAIRSSSGRADNGNRASDGRACFLQGREEKCQAGWDPCTYSTTGGNWDHLHWLEGPPSYFAPSVSGLSRRWYGSPNYGDWSVWCEANLITGGASCVS